ncbi:unnamed protein product [Haemonchus placei]|uniref:BPTI/Kunitz inhibitor domain-containing protein n=1 Tax=Haemonchus placei TaxID=6290 RepID=A0A0N4VUZ3_HAEPC|nr:unnamed protein product [Haemonchus placei]
MGSCGRSLNLLFQFFFDPELERCFTYLYEGCGGGRNTFYTESQCRNTCIPADKFTCGGNKKPRGSCSDKDMRCPFGSTCVIGALGVGLCCDSANERQWEYEIRQPPCRIGEILKRTVSHGEEVWIGKSCAHRFCPYGYECVQGRRVAHCCGPVPNFQERLYIEDDSFIKPPDIGFYLEADDNKFEAYQASQGLQREPKMNPHSSRSALGQCRPKFTSLCGLAYR